MRIGIQGILTVIEHNLPQQVDIDSVSNLRALGLVRSVRHYQNLVVNQGLEIIAALVGGGYGNPVVGSTTYNPDTVATVSGVSPVGAMVAEMKLGSDPSPTDPSNGDLALSGPTVYAARADLAAPRLLTTYANGDEVRFSTYLPAGFLAGTEITEEGLFTADGDLFARLKLDPTFTPSADYGVQFIHRVRFIPATELPPTPTYNTGLVDVNAAVLGSLPRQVPFADTIDVGVDVLGDMPVIVPPVLVGYYDTPSVPSPDRLGFEAPAQNGVPRYYTVFTPNPVFIAAADEGVTRRSGTAYDHTMGKNSTGTGTRRCFVIQRATWGFSYASPVPYNQVDVTVADDGDNSRWLGWGSSGGEHVWLTISGGMMTAETAAGSSSFAVSVGDVVSIQLDSVNLEVRFYLNSVLVATLAIASGVTYLSGLGEVPDWDDCNSEYRVTAGPTFHHTVETMYLYNAESLRT